MPLSIIPIPLPLLLVIVRLRSSLLQAPSSAARRQGRSTAVEVWLPTAGLAPACEVSPGDAAQGLVGNAEVLWQQTNDKLASGCSKEVMSERYQEIFSIYKAI